MYLKRLELQGFKSFADKTVLDFEQGVTAVVGPNGSGKSNISDAIRWVLGEMSAKTLRGGSMQDVIFSGTQKRKQVNYAEVSLVLDNSDHVFPIDFDEVIVTRRVFRSGETSYQINRANCRLRDIHELFMDTGLGRDGYSIIGQGNVSQVLSTKAEDRRSIFEEAAGIAKYKHRKEEAQHKLAGVQDNLVRIDDRVTELGKRVEPLRNQSEKARQYIELYEEYKQLDIHIGLHKIKNYEAQIVKHQTQIQSLGEELDALRRQSGETEQKISKLERKNAEYNKQSDALNEKLRTEEKRIAEINGEIKLSQNNITHNENQIKTIDADVCAAETDHHTWKADIASWDADIEEKKRAYQELEQTDAIQKEADLLSRQLNDCGDRIESRKNDGFELRKQIVSDTATRDSTETLRKNFLEQQETVQTKLASHNHDLEQTNQEIAAVRAEIADKSEKLSKMCARTEKQEQKLSDIQRELQENGIELTQLHNDYQAKQSRKRMLEDMENAYEGYARSVKSILTAPQLKHLAVYGTLSGLIHVGREYVTAIETALGGATQNIVVESEEDAKEAIAYLRANRIGRATFLPVSAVRGRKLEQEKELTQMTGFISIADALVTCDKKYREIICNLLGRVAVFDTIDHAIAASRKFHYRFKIVTLTGEIFNPGGSMAGGSHNKSVSFLSRANDIELLGKELSALAIDIREREKKQTAADHDRQNAERQLESYRPLIREYEDELLQLNGKAEHLQKSLTDSDETEQSLKGELTEIEQQLRETSDTIAELINKIRLNEKKAEETEADVCAMQEEYHRLKQLYEDKRTEDNDRNQRMQTIRQEINITREKRRMYQQRIDDGEKQIREKKQEKERLREENETIKKKIAEKKTQLADSAVHVEKLREQIAGIHHEQELIGEEQRKIRSSDQGLTEHRMQLSDEKTRVEAKILQLNIQKDNIVSRFWDKYEITYTAAAEMAIDIPEQSRTEERLSELGRQIKALGHVNMDAIEEYVSVKKEFEFLSEQKSDLEKSRMNLNDIITSMDELMQKNFSEQFQIINDSFGKVFRELFGGGNGRLYLSEPEHVLESGIEIEVQLPGKGRQNLSLYSGGEKSFIAIALLFAILNVKPTPFCILDEIDAALDDVNVSRFATYLSHYLEQTQFIVITHRRGTMEAAHLMYGVTMQEKGVSKLLSLHIDDVGENMVQ